MSNKKITKSTKVFTVKDLAVAVQNDINNITQSINNLQMIIQQHHQAIGLLMPLIESAVAEKQREEQLLSDLGIEPVGE